MVETKNGTQRSAGISYDELFAQDSRPVPDIFKLDSPMPPGPTVVDTKKYTSQVYHDLEVEKLWKRVWQLACHEDDIPNVGDSHVYDIASLSFIVVRAAEDEIKAFPNACLHRGRQILHEHEEGLHNFRCAFHGWSWELNGRLREVPCHWDFPTVTEKDYSLKEVQVDRWGGFVFINPDPDAAPLAEFLGNLSEQFPRIPFERRYKAAHIGKRLPCNWKVAQEAFMEAYHVVATHPTLLADMGDANSKYDVFGNYSRAMSSHGVASPHTGSDVITKPFADRRAFSKQRHELTGAIYERLDLDRVQITMPNGCKGVYDSVGHHLEGDKFHADIHLCNWVGGRLPDNVEDVATPDSCAAPAEKRAAAAAVRRNEFRKILGDAMMEQVSDAELIDAVYLSVFPNFSPWGTFNQIFYRFRPDGADPNHCIHECMFMLPVPTGQPRPKPAKYHFLDLDDDYLNAPEIGSLAKVFNQDTLNLPYVHKGLRNLDQVIFADYGETKIRHFHKLLEEWVGDLPSG